MTHSHLADPRLYDETTDTPGEGFILPKPTPSLDVVLPLPSELINDLIHTRNLPSSLLARAPTNTKRVWIYEAGLVDAVTFTMRMENHIHPIQLYQLINPLTASDLQKKYDTLPPQQLSQAPPWMVWNHSHHLLRIW